MDFSRELSVGELLDQLLADSLIDAFRITGTSVTVVQGTDHHSFPYDQARTFLTGMLKGRSWNRPVGDAGRTVGPSRIDADDLTLEAVLEAALALDMMTSVRKDAAGEMVTIELPACSTTMRSVEAVQFLSECVLNGLKMMQDQAASVRNRTARPPVWRRLSARSAAGSLQ